MTSLDQEKNESLLADFHYLNNESNDEQNNELKDDELMRYSRQILLDGWGLDAQERLKSSHVIIVGAGGLGCPASETLARAGVGHIHLIDHDKIEASNLQRQTLFFSQDIGEYKAKKACEMLQKINPHISVSFETTYLDDESVNQLVAMIDSIKHQTKRSVLLLDCTDNFAIRRLLNRVSVETHTPLLSASAIAMNGQLALYEPDNGTGCYECVFGDAIKHNTAENNCATSGVLASTTTVIGNLQANVALQFLGLNHNPIQGKLLNWDGRRMTQYLIGFKPNTDCEVCQ